MKRGGQLIQKGLSRSADCWRMILNRVVFYLAQSTIGGIALRANKKMLVQIQVRGKLKR